MAAKMATPIIIKIKFPSICKTCLQNLAPQTDAWWEHGKRGVECLTCRPRGLKPIPTATTTPPIGKPVTASTFKVKTQRVAGPISSGANIVVDPVDEDYLIVEKFQSNSNSLLKHEVRRTADSNLLYCTCNGYRNQDLCWHIKAVLIQQGGVATKQRANDWLYAQKPKWGVNTAAGRTATPPPIQNIPPPKPIPPSQPPPITGSSWGSIDQAKLDKVKAAAAAAKARAQPGMGPSGNPIPPIVVPPPPVSSVGTHEWLCRCGNKLETTHGPNTGLYEWFSVCHNCGRTDRSAFIYIGPAGPPPAPKPPPSWFNVLSALEDLLADVVTKHGATDDLRAHYERYKKLKAMALNPGSENEGRMALKRGIIELVKAAFD